MFIARIADTVLKGLPMEKYREVAKKLVSSTQTTITHKELTISFYRVGEIRVSIKGGAGNSERDYDWNLLEEMLFVKLPETLLTEYRNRPNLTIDEIVALDEIPQLPVDDIKRASETSEYVIITFKKGKLRTYNPIQELNDREFLEREKAYRQRQESR